MGEYAYQHSAYAYSFLCIYYRSCRHAPSKEGRIPDVKHYHNRSIKDYCYYSFAFAFASSLISPYFISQYKGGISVAAPILKGYMGAVLNSAVSGGAGWQGGGNY